MMSLLVWLPCPMFLLGGGLSGGEGLCPGGLLPRIRKADGTHPTGMFSCYLFKTARTRSVDPELFNLTILLSMP